jgi:phosphoribosylaminoimidazole carboxylase (NCAIR synthetase)
LAIFLTTSTSVFSLSKVMTSAKSTKDLLSLINKCPNNEEGSFYQMVNSEEDLKQAVGAIGLPAILKTATEGYDGKGQFLLHDTSQITQAWNSMQ